MISSPSSKMATCPIGIGSVVAKELDTETILALLGPQHADRTANKSISPFPRPEQTSKFVRWYDVGMRCASRGCSSPTYVKLKGVPYCMKHMIHNMDKLLNEMVSDESEPELVGFGEL